MIRLTLNLAPPGREPELEEVEAASIRDAVEGASKDGRRARVHFPIDGAAFFAAGRETRPKAELCRS